jgi:phenylpyruvate tautomerase PptA (4-oxalocrotonate tautomerase family)
MPIVEVEVVCDSEAEFQQYSAAALASALGGALGSHPGTVWVRLRLLSAANYAENESTVGSSELPAFVSVLHARVPQGEALAAEAKAITNTVAVFLGRAPDRVHVRYEPSAAGRQAFGGNLVG